METGEHAGKDDADKGGESDPELEPQTRAAFQLLRESYDNTAAFVADLLNDRKLQKRVRLILCALKPLHIEYAEDLRRHGEGFAETLYFQGDRATGAWYKSQMVQTFALLQDGKLTELFNLRPPPTRLENKMDPEATELTEDTAILKQLYVFVVEPCANRAWSQAFWTLSLPYAMAGLYATSWSDRSRTQAKLRLITMAVLKLENMLRDPSVLLPQNKGKARQLRKLQTQLGTTAWQLTREALVLGQQHDWCPRNEEIREFCRAVFGGPVSTKDALEAAFNYLKDSVKMSKHKTMSPWTKYFYLLANPTCKLSGVNHVVPSTQDFETLLRSQFNDQAVVSLKPFKFGTTMLGPEFPRPDKIIGQWKTAGFHSNRRSAAAYAYILHESHVDFRNVLNAWAG